MSALTCARIAFAYFSGYCTSNSNYWMAWAQHLAVERIHGRCHGRQGFTSQQPLRLFLQRAGLEQVDVVVTFRPRTHQSDNNDG